MVCQPITSSARSSALEFDVDTNRRVVGRIFDHRLAGLCLMNHGRNASEYSTAECSHTIPRAVSAPQASIERRGMGKQSTLG